MSPITKKSVAKTPDVESLLASLQHPDEPLIHELRAVIRSTHPAIQESVKWNAPSFATTEHFATFHLRAKVGVQLVLHLGAKARPDVDLRSSIPDPSQLLEWKSGDRAIVSIRDSSQLAKVREQLASIIRAWIPHVR